MLRVALVVAWTLLAVPVQAVLLTRQGRGKERFARAYWGGVARILGLQLRVLGTLAAARPVIFVCNHTSWADIVALGAVLPACFVAKGDVGRWPVIGTIARLGRTVFVSRSRESLGREQRVLEAKLAAGDNIILFPEGTTSDGNRILPFASAFLAPAFGPSPPAVQPVTIVYDRLDGKPAGPEGREEVAWYGDAELAPHFMRLGRRRGFRATIKLGAPVAPGAYENRKSMAAALEREIRGSAEALWAEG